VSLARPHAPNVPPQVRRHLAGGTPLPGGRRSGPLDCSPQEAVAGLEEIKRGLHGRPAIDTAAVLFRRCTNCGNEGPEAWPQCAFCDTCNHFTRHELVRRPGRAG
jgi:hypothetical protein